MNNPKRDEFAAERRVLIIEALSRWEDEDGRWGHEKAVDVLSAHELEWAGLDATPPPFVGTEATCSSCGESLNEDGICEWGDECLPHLSEPERARRALAIQKEN